MQSSWAETSTNKNSPRTRTALGRAGSQDYKLAHRTLPTAQESPLSAVMNKAALVSKKKKKRQRKKPHPHQLSPSVFLLGGGERGTLAAPGTPRSPRYAHRNLPKSPQNCNPIDGVCAVCLWGQGVGEPVPAGGGDS